MAAFSYLRIYKIDLGEDELDYVIEQLICEQMEGPIWHSEGKNLQLCIVDDKMAFFKLIFIRIKKKVLTWVFWKNTLPWGMKDVNTHKGL